MQTTPCNIWKELSKEIKFNFYENKKNSKKINFTKFKKYILENTTEKDLIIINCGHFIPTEKIGKNPLKTWELGCKLADYLNKNERFSKISLIINDLVISKENRKNIELPEKYSKLLKKYNLELLNHSLDNNLYSEKKCANRYSIQKKSKKWNIYPKNTITNYCESAIIYYYRDIIKQKATKSIWITPKCSYNNLINATEKYKKYENKKFKNYIYFTTNNCFK